MKNDITNFNKIFSELLMLDCSVPYEELKDTKILNEISRIIGGEDDLI